MARVISAAILVPLTILVVIYATPILYLIGIGILGTVCLYEYFGLIRSMGIKAQPVFGYIVFWLLLIAFRRNTFPETILVALVMLAAFLSAMWRYNQPVRERALALMAELLGILYFTLFLYPALPIRFDFGDKIGLQWTLILLIVIWAGDTAALVVGKAFGKSRFAPVLSPKKTNEGALAGLLAGVGIAVVIQRFVFRDLPINHVIIAAFLLGIFG